MAKKFDEVRIPFAKMTFSPDVPSTALGPNEYNAGLNVETDVRGIRSISGDEEISVTIPNGETPIYISGGFRRNDLFYYIVATLEGKWYAIAGGSTWTDITPPGMIAGNYSRAQNITEAWNGTVPFFNDERSHAARISFCSCACNHNCHITRFSVCNKILCSVQHIIIAIFFGNG